MENAIDVNGIGFRYVIGQCSLCGNEPLIFAVYNLTLWYGAIEAILYTAKSIHRYTMEHEKIVIRFISSPGNTILQYKRGPKKYCLRVVR